MFFKIGVLNSFTNFVGKHLRWSLRPATLLRRDSNTGYSSEINKIFTNTLFYRTPPVAASRLTNILLSLNEKLSVNVI